jgi:hypothetical protein
MIRLFWPQIEELILERDDKLHQLATTANDNNLLGDETAEVLSSIPIDINRQITELLAE